jgi:hypothetical protein
MRRRNGVPLVLAAVVGLVVLTAGTAIATLPPGGTFIDDNGNVHEPNIEAIAAAGITQGCNPPTNDRFCPAGSVTRAEIAALLVRAMGESAGMPAYQGYFSDVAVGQWYTGLVERAFQLGITTGYADGTFRPSATVSRAEMAAFVLRAIGDHLEAPIFMGVFADVPEESWFAEYVERLYQIGITSGCAVDPLRYCPHAPVRRDEMATFIAHAFGLSPVYPPPPATG